MSNGAVKTARTALHLLTTRGLPPMLESYTHVFREVLGAAPVIQHSVDAHVKISQTRREFEAMRAELEEAKRQVMLDLLNGARNRFDMESSLGQEVARARRDHIIIDRDAK